MPIGDPGVFGPAVSLSPSIQEALLELSAREERERSRATGARISMLERLDRTRDELLRHPDRIGSPATLINNAWGNAGHVIRHRLQLLDGTASPEETSDERCKRKERMITLATRYSTDCGETDLRVAFLRLQIHELISQLGNAPRDQGILERLLRGDEAEEIADAFEVPLQRAQVWISRARKRARTQWLAA